MSLLTEIVLDQGLLSLVNDQISDYLAAELIDHSDKSIINNFIT